MKIPTQLELQLFAALRAAEEMVEYYHDHEGCQHTLKQVREAIAAGQHHGCDNKP